jgi:hypothetical protein
MSFWVVTMIEIARAITLAACLLLTNTAHAEEMTAEQMKAMNVCTRFPAAHPIVDGVPSRGGPVGDAQEQFMFKYAVEQVRKQHKDPTTTIGIAPLRMFVYDWCERRSMSLVSPSKVEANTLWITWLPICISSIMGSIVSTIVPLAIDACPFPVTLACPELMSSSARL